MQNTLDPRIKEIIEDKEKWARFINNFALSRESKVYFIRCNEFVKIGTCNTTIPYRLSQLQMGCPYELEVEAFIPADREIEQKIHKQLEQFWHKGEWFKLTKDDVKALIKTWLINKE